MSEEAENPVTFKEIWGTLSKINVNEHTEKKGNLTYLSWAWAWGVMMDNFPDTEYHFGSDEAHEDGSVTVHVDIVIGTCVRHMWLPVMDHRNKSIIHPSSRDISDSKMRCLVKGFAMFGLGHYIYAGEDIPAKRDEKPAELTDSQKEVIRVVTEVTEVEIKAAESQKALNDFYKKNRKEMQRVKALSEKAFNDLVDMFTARKKELA